jgi:hypothetical protein
MRDQLKTDQHGQTTLGKERMETAVTRAHKIETTESGE